LLSNFLRNRQEYDFLQVHQENEPKEDAHVTRCFALACGALKQPAHSIPSAPPMLGA
jgi:hypothetical protein